MPFQKSCTTQDLVLYTTYIEDRIDLKYIHKYVGVNLTWRKRSKSEKSKYLFNVKRQYQYHIIAITEIGKYKIKVGREVHLLAPRHPEINQVKKCK